MNHRLTCYTLFDITYTGVLNRAKPSEKDMTVDWVYKRNTQCNFDTILQAVSLRAQPEVTKKPKKVDMFFKENNFFGEEFKKVKTQIQCWTFEFEVHHSSVFEEGDNELGYLFKDCHKIPMIKCGTEVSELSNFLDTSFEHRNIFFIKYKDE